MSKDERLIIAGLEDGSAIAFGLHFGVGEWCVSYKQAL